MDVEQGLRTHGAPGTRPVMVVGAAGQLGRTIVASLSRRAPVIARTRRELELTDATEVNRQVQEARPAAIINCAGYNQVDKAEDEPETAMEANAFVVLTLARAAAAAAATFVQYSSDFVFDGETDRPYREDDRPSPRGVYAASKLLGEWFAASAPSHYVLRVESLFGGVDRRTSSLDRIIDAISAGDPVKVFRDRIVSPSYAWDVAAATVAILEKRPSGGLYHCVNTGSATWEEVARTIHRALGSTAEIVPIMMSDLKLAAARPRYAALSNTKLRKAGIEMPRWQDAVARALEERTARNEEQRTEP